MRAIPPLTLLILLSASFALSAGETTTNPPVTFQKDIGPLFQKCCVQCHGEPKAKGGLRLDTQELVMKGSKGKPAVLPGNSAKSNLLRMVTKPGKHGGYAHPPRQPLSADQITLIRSWIDQGAR